MAQDEAAIIEPENNLVTPSTITQIGLNTATKQRDKGMEQYIQMRFQEENQRKNTLEIDLNLELQSLQNQAKFQSVDEEVFQQLPDHLVNANPIDRAAIDKPIQWVAGMMEVQNDPYNKIQTMEQMIHNSLNTEQNEQQKLDTKICQFLKGSSGRKIIKRPSRGNYKGNIGDHSTRIGKGEYSQMMRTLNFDHNEAKESHSRGEKIIAVSEKTRKEREKQMQNQINQNM